MVNGPSSPFHESDEASLDEIEHQCVLHFQGPLKPSKNAVFDPFRDPGCTGVTQARSSTGLSAQILLICDPLMGKNGRFCSAATSGRFSI
jgi:hypothetical protein